MSTTSKHPLYHLLEPYLKAESPEYAIMINGEWGSGKTYYIRNQILQDMANEEEEAQPLKILYASANGVKSIEELMFQIKWEKLSGHLKTMRHVGKWGEVILKNLPVGLIANSIVPGTGEFISKFKSFLGGMINDTKSKISFQDLVNFDNDDIIIIDDLERVHNDCDLIGLLGEINTAFVEHNRVKTILVCDEGQLWSRFIDNEPQSVQNAQTNRDTTDNGTDSASDYKRRLVGTTRDYMDAKEKLVRRTLKFAYHPETLEVFRDTSLPTEVFNLIKQYYSSVDSQNLRSFQFIIENLKTVWHAIAHTDIGTIMREYITMTVMIDTFAYIDGDLRPKYITHWASTIGYISYYDESDPNSNKHYSKSSKFGRLISNYSVSYTHLTLPTKRIV